MKLYEVMQRNVEVIPSETTVREAAQRMKQRDVGALPVIVDEVIAGMVTDRDLVVRSLAKGDSPDDARVGDVMTRATAWCYEDDDVEDASDVMIQHQVQRLLVLDHDENLVGIVSLGALARARANPPAVTHALEEIKAPTKSSALGVSGGQARR